MLGVVVSVLICVLCVEVWSVVEVRFVLRVVIFLL